MKNTIRIGAVAAASALALAACSAAPETTPEPTETDTGTPVETVDYKACMVSDQGGFDDASFNESAFNGLTRASEELGIDIATAESSSESDFGPNIAAQVAEGCDLIITVGFLLGDATAE
ncbi:MAG: BMP family ABC transporter substrate-binding protein, partial [Demequina sp.]